MDQSSIKILDKDGSEHVLATDLKVSDPEDLPFAGANILFDLAVDSREMFI